MPGVHSDENSVEVTFVWGTSMMVEWKLKGLHRNPTVARTCSRPNPTVFNPLSRDTQLRVCLGLFSL